MIGIWDMTGPNLQSTIVITKDSAFVQGNAYTWRFDNSTIYFKYHGDSIPGLYKKWELNYKFNSKKDTIYFKRPVAPMFLDSHVKLNNVYEYFMHQNRAKIKLPKTNKNLVLLENYKFGLNIFTFFKNNRLVLETKGYNSINQSGLMFGYQRFASQIKEKDWPKIEAILYTDASISEKRVDSIKKIIRNQLPPDIKIFRVYTNTSVDYTKFDWNQPIQWYGIYE